MDDLYLSIIRLSSPLFRIFVFVDSVAYPDRVKVTRLFYGGGPWSADRDV